MYPTILSCDWGTSSFRLRLVKTESGEILAETRNAPGIGELHTQWVAAGKPGKERFHFYRSHLKAAIHLLEPASAGHIPLFISGMASSTLGMHLVPYGEMPFDFANDRLPYTFFAADNDFDYPVYLVGGLKSELDVMRGEETILLGLPDLPGTVLAILPGTHSKHVLIRDQKLLTCKTYMTGEIFDLLAKKSILSSSLKNAGAESHHELFKEGVLSARSGNLLHTVFQVRTHQIFGRYSPEENFQLLSGMVIGTELKDLEINEEPLLLVTGSSLLHQYQAALEILGHGAQLKIVDADKALLKGHLKLATQFTTSFPSITE